MTLRTDHVAGTFFYRLWPSGHCAVRRLAVRHAGFPAPASLPDILAVLTDLVRPRAPLPRLRKQTVRHAGLGGRRARRACRVAHRRGHRHIRLARLSHHRCAVGSSPCWWWPSNGDGCFPPRSTALVSSFSLTFFVLRLKKFRSKPGRSGFKNIPLETVWHSLLSRLFRRPGAAQCLVRVSRLPGRHAGGRVARHRAADAASGSFSR